MLEVDGTQSTERELQRLDTWTPLPTDLPTKIVRRTTEHLYITTHLPTRRVRRKAEHLNITKRNASNV
jgi:hypothetical protein